MKASQASPGVIRGHPRLGLSIAAAVAALALHGCGGAEPATKSEPILVARESPVALRMVRMTRAAAGPIYLTWIAGTPDPASLAEDARAICGDGADCGVFAWSEPDHVAKQYPLDPNSMKRVAFHYDRTSGRGGTSRYDCTRFTQIAEQECLEGTYGVHHGQKK